MDTKTLIDNIVRQTTVLIAQLSTAAGIRAPLTSIADQVFLDLAREIEDQRVSQKVVADMFGMALRTYQRRIQRITQSSTNRDRTLWEAVVEFVANEGRVTRAQLQQTFHREDERSFAAVLHDLVHSGIAYNTGRGSSAVFGLTNSVDRQILLDQARQETVAEFVALTVCREGSASASDIAAILGCEKTAAEEALSTLAESGRVHRQSDTQPVQYRTGSFAIPVGAESGWEVAALDHFQAVAATIAAKLRRGSPGSPYSARDDTVGGATLAFEIDADHPLRSEVLGLLRRVREEVNELWDRVERHNQSSPVAEDGLQRVTFYFGQNSTERPASEQGCGNE